MDFLLTEEQLMLRENVKRFCQKELTKEYVRWMDENVNYPPDDLWRKIADLGLMGLNIPEEYGGSGLGIVSQVVAWEELATASPAVALAIGSATVAAKPIMEMGTKAQQEFFLPKIANGDLKTCLCLTEPGGGTDLLGAMRTTAVKKSDKYILNGQKVFITGAHVADYIMAIAITDPTVKRHQGISLFLVDAKSPGITTKLIKKMGCHAIGTNEVFFDNVEVPEENLLGQLNNGWLQMVTVLNPERIGTSVLSLGIAKAALKDAIEYSLQRQAFGVPIGKFQILQHYMADMAIEIENARNVIYKSAFLCEKGMPYHMEASIAKIVAGRASEIAATKGMEILGGYGYCNEYDMQRYFRDYKQMIFSPISEEMAKNMIAQWMGLPKSY